MSLFGFGKKKEEKIAAGALNIGSVKILGAGCKSCHKLYENAKEAVKKIGLPVEVEYVTDMEKIMKYGVMSMPAVVVNEKVVSTGKVLTSDGVLSLLKKVGK